VPDLVCETFLQPARRPAPLSRPCAITLASGISWISKVGAVYQQRPCRLL